MHVDNLEETDEKLPAREQDLRRRRPRDKLREARLRTGDLDLNVYTWHEGTAHINAITLKNTQTKQNGMPVTPRVYKHS